MAIEFKVVTPDEVVLDLRVEYVYLPGSMGELGILDHHTDMITALIPGELRYKPLNEPESHWVVGNGFAQIHENRVLIVTDFVVTPSVIDENNVELAIEEAKKVLQHRREMSKEEVDRFEANLTKQIIMLNFKRKNGSSRN